MVLEHVTFVIAPEHRTAFERDAVPRARAILLRLGARSVVAARGVEDPSRYVVLVEWESVEAHLSIVDDPDLVEFQEWSGPLFASAPELAHLELLP